MSGTYTIRGRTWCIGSGTVPGPRDARESDVTVRCGECGRGCVRVRRGGTIAHHAPPGTRGRPPRVERLPAKAGFRRRAMMWMMKQAGTHVLDIAEAFGVSDKQVYQLVREYEVLLSRRAATAAEWVEPWAERLRAAGAI